MKTRLYSSLFVAALSCGIAAGLACRQSSARGEGNQAAPAAAAARDGKPQSVVAVEDPTVRRVIAASVAQVNVTKGYDPAYVRLAYPNGDVPIVTGVCSDVLIRAFRNVGVDLQKEVHEDMRQNFAAYPKRWGLKRPDTNIDHRRVPNLMTYFKRRGKAVPVTANAGDYRPGDVVAWDLGDGITHIGLMTDIPAEVGGRLRVVHNIGAGAQVEDVLFSWKIIGHYRFF